MGNQAEAAEVTFDGNILTTSPTNAVIDVDGGGANFGIDITNAAFSSYKTLTLNSPGNNTYNMFGAWTDKKPTDYPADPTAADLNGYTVNVKGGTWGTIMGAFAQGAEQTPGNFDFVSGNASGNIVNIYDGEGFMSIIGGNSASGSAKDNIVNLFGGDLSGATITAGSAYSGNEGTEASGNIINILSELSIGWINGGGCDVSSTNNTLNVAAKSSVGGLAYIQNINFFLPKDMSANDGPMLTVENSAMIGGAEIGVMAKDGTFTKLKANDKVTLLNAPGGILDPTGAGVGTVQKIKDAGEIKIPTSLTEVETLGYDISQDDKNIYATITKVPGEESGGGESGGGSGGGDVPINPTDTTNDILKSPVEVRAAAVTMLNAGADMMATQGFSQAANAVAVEAAESGQTNAQGAPMASTFTPFAAFGGSSMRAESGSHVDTKGFGINVGFAKEFSNSQGKLLFGPVVEYGGGKYDSYNNDVHGDGGSHYWGFGLMARQTNHDGFYYEGSVRYGRVTSDYSANLPTGVHASYDSASNYWAAHLGLGKVFAAGKQDTVDGYLKYFYSHQGGDDTDIKLTATGGTATQHASFDAVNSHRIRIGARYTHKINDMNSLYGGLAYQYEFGGEARAHYAGTPGEAPSPSVKGSSGMLELGWQVKPGGPLTLDLGVAGWAGKQRGGSVQLGVNWTF